MVKPGLNDSKGEKEPLLSKQKQENVDSVDGKKKDVKKKASVRTMFRYATSLDYFLMIFGTLFAIVHGAGFPLLTIVFGDMSNLLLSGVVNNFTVEETNTTLNTSHIISLTTDLNPNIRLGRQLLQSVNDPQPPQIINSPNNQSNTQSANSNNQAIKPSNIASNIARNNPVTATPETLNVNNQVKDGDNPTRINENPAKIIDSVANGKGSLDDASQSNSVYETTPIERTTPQIAPVTETTETLNVNNQIKNEDKPTRINENPEKIIDSVADGKGSLDDALQLNTVYKTTTTESTTSTWLTKNNLDLTDSGKENEQIEIPNTTTTKSSWTDHRNTNKEERSNVTLTEAVTSAYTFLTSTQFPSINLGLSIDLFNEKMTEFSLYYVGISAIVFISTLFQTYFWQLSCERQIYKIRQEFFYQALRQEIGWFDQHQSGEMTTRLADDLERIREGIGEKIGTFIQHTSSFVVGFVVGFIKGWELTLVIMSLTPLLALSSAFVGRLIATSTKREQQKYAEAGGIAEEVLSSMKTVTAFNGQEREVDRYCNSLQSGFNLAIRKYKFMSIGIGFTFLVLYSAYALAFWYGSQLILRGDLLPGSVYTVFFAVLIGSNALGQTSGPLNSVSVAAGSAYNIFKIIDTIPTIDPYSIGGKILDSVQGNIEFKSVKFNYPSRPDVQVLRNFNLNIKPGQTIALCGSSGSGKSTIVNLLLRFYDVLEGKITLDGHNIKTINLPWLRHIIGVVSQEPILFDRSIAENIRYGRSDVTYDEIVNAAKMANAHSFVCSLPEAYSTLVGERGAQLSGGQKQRIAIARALVRDPKILLLDEATSALDSESESIVQEALDKAGKGRTTVVVAHRLSTIRNADVIHAMENGIIKESGTHDELMNREGIYYSLVTKQTFDDGEGGYSSTDYDKTESRKQSFRKRLLTYQSSIGSTVGDMQENRLKFEAMEEEVEMAKFSQIAKAMKPEWLSNTVGILACVLTGLIMPVFAIFFAQMFEVFSLPAEEMESASVFWACMYLLLAVLQFFGFSIRINYLAKASENLTKRLRYLAFKNILRQDIGWFDDDAHSTGKISTRLATDAPMVKAAAGVRIASLVSACVTMIGGLVVAFIFGWKLALAITATVPLLILGGSFQMKMAKGKQQRDQILMADAGRVSSEALLNIKTVQALTREETFFQKYIGHLIEPFCESKKQAIYLALGFAFSQSIIFLIYAGAFRLGAYLIVIGDMSVINIYRVFFAISFSAVSVGEWSSYLPDYTKAKLSAALMFHLIKMDPKIDSYSEGGIKPNIIGEIQLKNVHFKYPSRPNVRVLKNMNLYVKSGQTLALVGHSGCGKSTVVSLIERFYDPTQGKVLIDGHDLRTMNLKYVRENIAIVDQEPILFNCSIKDNIKYGMTRKVLDDELINACKSANIHDFIASLPDGYNTNCGDKGTQLSGGQKQRISIARAIIRNPRILLLDEATSALDTESEKLVQDALEAAKSGRTCIIIAHRLATIQNADIIAVIDKGNVVESGSHQELVAKKGRYYSLTKKQRIAH